MHQQIFSVWSLCLNTHVLQTALSALNNLRTDKIDIKVFSERGCSSIPRINAGCSSIPRINALTSVFLFSNYFMMKLIFSITDVFAMKKSLVYNFIWIILFHKMTMFDIITTNIKEYRWEWEKDWSEKVRRRTLLLWKNNNIEIFKNIIYFLQTLNRVRSTLVQSVENRCIYSLVFHLVFLYLKSSSSLQHILSW